MMQVIRITLKFSMVKLWRTFKVVRTIPDSSMAEQFAVNEKVLGSSPSRGATIDDRYNSRSYQMVL